MATESTVPNYYCQPVAVAIRKLGHHSTGGDRYRRTPSELTEAHSLGFREIVNLGSRGVTVASDRAQIHPLADPRGCPLIRRK
jgi:hypothetical protein